MSETPTNFESERRSYQLLIKEAEREAANAKAELARLKAQLDQFKKDNPRDGEWLDTWGACRICDGEIPHGHDANCHLYRQEMSIHTLKQERDTLKAQVEASKIRNIVTHIKNICDKCGHTSTEDGCAFCLKNQNESLVKDKELWDEIIAEADHGRQKYAGSATNFDHDDRHTLGDWRTFIENKAGDLDVFPDGAEGMDTRHKFVQIAGLAISAIQSFDRRQSIDKALCEKEKP
jgi:hypothetical protein